MFKVGDIVIDEEENKRTILAVLGKVFLPSHPEYLDEASPNWRTFQEAERLGWRVEGKHSGNPCSCLFTEPPVEPAEVEGNLPRHYHNYHIFDGEFKCDCQPSLSEAPWKPGCEGEYYFINSKGDVESDFWTNDKIDKYRFAVNNVFPTREEAEAHVEAVKRAYKN